MLEHSRQFDLGGTAERAQVCQSLREAADSGFAPYFYECLLDFARPKPESGAETDRPRPCSGAVDRGRRNVHIAACGCAAIRQPLWRRRRKVRDSRCQLPPCLQIASRGNCPVAESASPLFCTTVRASSRQISSSPMGGRSVEGGNGSRSLRARGRATTRPRTRRLNLDARGTRSRLWLQDRPAPRPPRCAGTTTSQPFRHFRFRPHASAHRRRARTGQDRCRIRRRSCR